MCRCSSLRIVADRGFLLLVVPYRYSSLYEIVVIVLAVVAPGTNAGPCVADALRRLESIMCRQNATCL